jgi:hypothetical protein
VRKIRQTFDGSRVVKRLLEGMLLTVNRAIPPRLMAHYMHLLKTNSSITDTWGYHIRPIHYYEPLPDFREISAARLNVRRLSPAINLRLPQQLALLERLGAAYGAELAMIATPLVPDGFDFKNSYFAGLDAAVYYALIRDLKPAKVVEIGSGYSTQIAAKALERNEYEGRAGELICIEPYPEARLTQSGIRFHLVQKKIQDVDLSFFDCLGENDILFIDSSHVVCVESDVCFELLDLLPRVARGVWIHIHDIFFPVNYPPEWVIARRIAFNEQYLLEAFLAFNRAFSMQLANHWMWLEQIEAVRSFFPQNEFRQDSDAIDAASLWLKRDR